jgi:hypothetical protein
VVVEAGQAAVHGDAGAGQWAALVAAMVLAAELWWLYFDSAAEVNLKVLELSGGSPTMARAIFAVGHMLPAFALLLTAAGVGLLLEDEPPDAAAWAACVGAGIYLLGTRTFLRGSRRVPGVVRVLVIVATFQLPADPGAVGARLPVGAHRVGRHVRRADHPAGGRGGAGRGRLTALARAPAEWDDPTRVSAPFERG